MVGHSISLTYYNNDYSFTGDCSNVPSTTPSSTAPAATASESTTESTTEGTTEGTTAGDNTHIITMSEVC